MLYVRVFGNSTVLFPVLEVKVLDKAMGEGGGGDGVGGVGGKSEGKKTSDPPKGKKKGKGGGKGGSKIEKMLMNAAEYYDDGKGSTTKGVAAPGKGAQGEVQGKGPSPKGEAQGGEGEGESAAEGEGESPEAEGEGEGLKNGKKKAGKSKAVAHRKGKFSLQHCIFTCCREFPVSGTTPGKSKSTVASRKGSTLLPSSQKNTGSAAAVKQRKGSSLTVAQRKGATNTPDMTVKNSMWRSGKIVDKSRSGGGGGREAEGESEAEVGDKGKGSVRACFPTLIWKKL